MNEYFLGFQRKDGSTGIRNKLLIISITGLTGPTSRKISNLLQDTLFVDNPYGGGIIGEDKIRQDNAIIGFAKNPNVGAVLIISADPPKGEFIKQCDSSVFSDETIKSIMDDIGREMDNG